MFLSQVDAFVPAHMRSSTPVHVVATGGVRNLLITDPLKATAIFEGVRVALAQSAYLSHPSFVTWLSGEQEVNKCKKYDDAREKKNTHTQDQKNKTKNAVSLFETLSCVKGAFAWLAAHSLLRIQDLSAEVFCIPLSLLKRAIIDDGRLIKNLVCVCVVVGRYCGSRRGYDANCSGEPPAECISESFQNER